ncbi:fructosamine kinase family protein [Parasulfuritortus cantonensis]|uniref:Fructosamine kinase family protein n=1 Tax=Parasulfuritortus cantonensis TaxID=2528202 RepID=A0A4R1BD91_9PROT|nr:fructosamine kinase family protein [Parasulfuritortus cantonensis]TCJ14948.1 fructosamine kinase family protein [Parasulfuritortus cantonensis]
MSGLAEAIGAATGAAFAIATRQPVGGGDINEAERLVGRDGRRYFVKVNRAERLAMFEAEAEGLAEILASGAIAAPQPVCSGVDGGRAFLVLEYLELDGRGDAGELGRRLAAMHRQRHATFGWRRDNTIGATAQVNEPAPAWVDFLRERRLAFQLGLAARNGAPRRLVEQGERLLAGLGGFFPGYTPVPSLLHGDLWGGNYGYAGGRPVLFDPAVYYGDREADLAMTELFGGFPAAFMAAYHEAWPIDPGYPVRRSLYNLYHVLNHYNLFGGGYAGQAERMIAMLLAESR